MSRKLARNTVERINPEFFYTKEKYLLYLRHVFAYECVLAYADATSDVLEIGFGNGYGTLMLAEAAHSVHAVDVDAETVALAKQKHAEADCTFELYDGHRLPFDDNRFDLVVALQVIEHIEDDAGFVAESYRVLKPGGTLLITTPNKKHRVGPDGKIWNKFHRREYLPAELGAVLGTSFSTVRVHGIKGHEEAQRIEIQRVKRGFSLRKIIPEFVRYYLAGDSTSRYGTDAFFVIREDVESSLDLFGVCTK